MAMGGAKAEQMFPTTASPAEEALGFMRGQAQFPGDPDPRPIVLLDLGERLAVKILYPKVATIIKVDLRVLGCAEAELGLWHCCRDWALG